MRAFSNTERRILESSPHVVKISVKHVTYTEEFISLMLSGTYKDESREDFFNKTLEVSCFDKKYVDSCLGRWRIALPRASETRGRKKSIKNMSVEELKAENAYQREVIAHLKKIRGLTDSDL